LKKTLLVIVLITLVLACSILCFQVWSLKSEPSSETPLSSSEKEHFFKDVLAEADVSTQTFSLAFTPTFDERKMETFSFSNKNRSTEAISCIEQFITALSYDENESASLDPSDYEGMTGGVYGYLNIAVTPTTSVVIWIEDQTRCSIFIYEAGGNSYVAKYTVEASACDDLRKLCGFSPIVSLEDQLEQRRQEREAAKP